MNDLNNMSSGRKALNFVGCGIGILLGYAMLMDASGRQSVGPAILGVVIIGYCGRFLYRNFFSSHRKASATGHDEREVSTITSPTASSQSLDEEVAKPVDQAISGNSSAAPAPKTKLWSILGTIAVIVAIILSNGIGRLIGGWAGSESATQSADDFIQDDSVQEYLASDYGFKAHFPGFPTKEVQYMPIEDYDIPYVTYSRAINGGNETYFIAVWDYRNTPVSNSDLSLEGAINGMAQGMSGARLLSTTPAPLGGLPGLEGTMSIPIEGQTYDSYARLTARDQQVFGVWTAGVERSKFEAFATSFQFTD